MRRQIILQKNGRTDLVYKGFILTSLLLQSAVYHCLMGQDRREPLIVQLYRHFGMKLLPALNKTDNTLIVLTRQSVRLLRIANDDAFHRLGGHVTLNKRQKFRCRNSRQSITDEMQWIGDCQSRTLPSVVY